MLCKIQGGKCLKRVHWKAQIDTPPRLTSIMELTSRTIARMWNRTGYACYVQKRGDEWMLTLEMNGQVLRESVVDSPGEAIRQSDELFKSIIGRPPGTAS